MNALMGNLETSVLTMCVDMFYVVGSSYGGGNFHIPLCGIVYARNWLATEGEGDKTLR
jgi:hypothetical protein